MPPNTAVPIPTKFNKPACDPCTPDDELLIGPARSVTESATFEVTDTPVVIRTFGLKAFPDAVVTIEQKLSICGEELFEPLCAGGRPCTLNSGTNARRLSTSGLYRVTLTGADPDDVWVTQKPDHVKCGR